MIFSFNPCRIHRQTSAPPQVRRSRLHYGDFLCVRADLWPLHLCLCARDKLHWFKATSKQLYWPGYTLTLHTHTVAGYLHMVSVFLRHMMKYWRNRVGGTQCVYACVLVKLCCLFHNRCDEIRGQVSDSNTACHGNTHSLGAALALCANTHTPNTRICWLSSYTWWTPSQGNHLRYTCAADISTSTWFCSLSLFVCVCVSFGQIQTPCASTCCLVPSLFLVVFFCSSLFRLRASWSVEPRGDSQFKVWLTVGV